MGKMEDYFTKHLRFHAWIHIFMGLGLAWLLSLIWQGYSGISLVLGIVFGAAGIAGLIYPLFAKQ